MHIILGALTSIITILYLLDRMGISLGGMNPFHWYRRRAFMTKYGSDPIFSIGDPVHVAAHLLAAPQLIENQLQKLAARNRNLFSNEQADSMMQMMRMVVSADGEMNPHQAEFIDGLRSQFVQRDRRQGTWS
jgi:hypothetical protein